MNFLLEPQQYGQFVNTTGTAYLVPGATPYIKSSISKNPILGADAECAQDEWSSIATWAAPGATLWANIWQEVKAA